ncbi:MAG: hypothetical protein ABMA13_11180 [Chthoniobacteraceae bacterium]
MNPRILLPLIAAASLLRAENEIGFIERFALAPDRESVLTELVPGTEDYYFFHALHFQNSKQPTKLAAILDQWRKRNPGSAQRRVIENREALLAYDGDPQRTLTFLRNHFQLHFNHVREQPDAKPNLPTQLDPERIAREVFVRAALSDDDLGKCSGEALARLVVDKAPLRPAQRRALLSRIERPNVPGLLELIAADLATQESRGFGEHPIHRLLLPAQLDQLVKLRPQLASEQAFVFARLRHLAPSAEEDVEFDAAAREAWLERTWTYAKSLPAAFNSLKAALLYRRLDHDRKEGIYDEARFTEYLKLPRQTHYVAPRWIERLQNANTTWCDLNARFDEAALVFPPIGNDEPLVREFFLHRFAAKPQAGWESFAEWVRDTWLRPVYAEALLVRGLGNAEQLASLLTPADFQRLSDRVDLDFLPTNPQFSPPADDVSLDLEVKNAPKLIVKVYELNALNYFLTNKRQLNTDLPLDGLVANAETTHEFAEPPLRRVRRTFKFPELKGRRGAWIVEFIGGGRSSRALVRKGQWSVVQQTGAAGDLLTVLDENHAPVPDAAVWLDGRKLTPDAKTGASLVPFTAQPGRKPVIVSDASGTFATLTEFEHHAESYALDTQFHIEREQLLAGREATLSIRVALRLHEAVLPLSLLHQPRLTLTTRTLEGIETTREVKDLKLDATALFTHRFPVPERLASVSATLSAQVEQLSAGNAKMPLDASQQWQLNGIDRTDSTFDGHLVRADGGYVFELLGKNAESVADRQVVFAFTHEHFSHPVHVPLRTDERGRVALGALPQMAAVLVHLPDERKLQWPLDDAWRAHDGTIHVVANRPLEIPLERPALGNRAALLETRASGYTADLSSRLALHNDGRAPHVSVAGLPPGDYSLLLPDEGRNVALKVTAGDTARGWVFGPARSLELPPAKPLRIASIETGGTEIVVTVANANTFTRVHVAATRYVNPDTSLITLGGFTRFSSAEERPARNPNLFAAGRDIGDEYRYILDRRYALKFPGNMLARPGLLLNPWEKRSTDQRALDQKGTQPAPGTAGGRGAMSKDKAPANPMPALAAALALAPEGGTNLDFLANVAPVLTDLVPDANGVVRIDRAKLGDRPLVQVLATDLRDADWRQIALPEAPAQLRDLRLARNLDPAKPFAEKKRFSALTQGQTLTLEDGRTSELETYDSLASVFALYRTLSSDATLAKFAWVLEWPRLKDEEKRAKYGEFACHELNVFLARKDPDFFAKIVLPYLRNKKDKTFLDDYLLAVDLRRYLEPWRFGQLNAAERALLAARLAAESANVARHLRERWELVPPKTAELNRWFETALRGRAMEEGVRAGAAVELMQRTADAAGRLEAHSAPRPASAPTPAPASSLAARKMANLADTTMPMEAKREINGLKAGKDVTLGEADAFAFRIVAVGEAELQRAQAKAQAYYRKLGPTKEWAENNYYHLAIEQQGPELIPVNVFWRDFAAWIADGAKAPFLSAHFAEAHRNFAEMMLALAVLDLPFDAPKHVTKTEGTRFTLTAGGPLVVVHKEILPAAPADGQTELLVSQNFYRHGDRYRQEGNEKFDKYVTDEFLAGAVYGANVVVTNPSSSPQKLELLLQIPRGALPVLGAKATESRRIRLEPFTTQSFEYAFYFPAPEATGAKFPHYPVHVASDERIVGAAKAFSFPVVARLTQVDKASWDFVSQNGSEANVFTYLDQNNVERIDLTRIAWRCRQSADFFRRLVALLGARHRFDATIYSYAVEQRDTATLREWLRHRDELPALCGAWFDSKLVRFDPTERRSFEHLEYSPLINQRVHRLGAEQRIANNVVLGQYRTLLTQLAHKPALDANDSLSVTGFLFLQDRVDEALARFKTIDAAALPTRLQHDYFRCYAALYESDVAAARGIANQHSEHPVERWRNLFREVLVQLDEIEGKAGVVKQDGTQPDRERDTTGLASKDPTFDFKVENRTIALTWRNLGEVTLNYYLIDPEFSFSSNPFVSADAGRSSIIKPTQSVRLPLPAEKDALDVALPAEFAKANVLVEIVGAGQRKAQTYHANTLALTLAENYGRIELRDPAAKPVAKAYVKVYARLRGGTVRFFKDGYTDLRGKFDYASLNSSDAVALVPIPGSGGGGEGSLDTQMLRPGELDQVERLSVLVLSENHGALVREVAPPAR